MPGNLTSQWHTEETKHGTWTQMYIMCVCKSVPMSPSTPCYSPLALTEMVAPSEILSPDGKRGLPREKKFKRDIC